MPELNLIVGDEENNNITGTAEDDIVQGFGGDLVAGSIGSEMFTISTVATSNEHRFIYDAGSGDLFYDNDEVGANEQIKIAGLGTNLALTHNNY